MTNKILKSVAFIALIILIGSGCLRAQQHYEEPISQGEKQVLTQSHTPDIQNPSEPWFSIRSVIFDNDFNILPGSILVLSLKGIDFDLEDIPLTVGETLDYQFLDQEIQLNEVQPWNVFLKLTLISRKDEWMSGGSSTADLLEFNYQLSVESGASNLKETGTLVLGTYEGFYYYDD